MSAYGDVKEVAKDAWGVGTDIAQYAYGDKDIDGTPSAPANGQMQAVPDGGFKPSAGNTMLGSAVDSVMGLFS